MVLGSITSAFISPILLYPLADTTDDEVLGLDGVANTKEKCQRKIQFSKDAHLISYKANAFNRKLSPHVNINYLERALQYFSTVPGFGPMQL